MWWISNHDQKAFHSSEDKKNDKKRVNSMKFHPYLPRPHKEVEKLSPVAFD